MKITNETEYERIMEEILHLMNQGEGNLNKEEKEKLRNLALAAQVYEQNLYTIPAPTTLEGMIELRMYEMKLKQKDLAKTLGVSDAKLSLILSGKQKPDIPFIKAVHTKLNVSADFILQHV
ncbi:MAG: helix-turn-helix domain-containing protein [Spirosomataceae bacterium]